MNDLPEVGGRRLEGTLADFERACRVLIGEELEKPAPNNALIATLSDGVRLAREHADVMTKGWRR